MSTNPIDNNPTPKTTGSLEELFRHHLGEEAAVPPRPLLWDQLDNSLLTKQNEAYRRRLTATRWLAAASLLLATLAGGGWWAGRTDLPGGPGMATNRPRATSSPSTNAVAGHSDGAAQSEAALAGGGRAAAGSTAAAGRVAAGGNDASSGTGVGQRSAANQGGPLSSRPTTTTVATARRPGFSPEAAARYAPRTRYPVTAAPARALAPTVASSTASTETAASRATDAASASPAIAANQPVDSGLSPASGQPALAPELAAAAGNTAVASGAAAGVAAPETGAAGATVPAEVSLLAVRPAALSLAAAGRLPAGLATVPVAPLPDADRHRWRYGASYTAGIFNPNINFSRSGIDPAFDYDRSPAFGADSPALTEVAATEYRNNLRPGLSQRIALLATRHLGGHWSVSTGVELARANAESASSLGFVGEQLFDLNQLTKSQPQPLHTTSFQYTTAGLPFEVYYANPVKRGWSLYGRLGGVVTALLGARSDVAGDPEATRSYSLASSGGPYRHLSGSLRGGMGTQFRSTSQWAFTVGPVAEIGVLAMNAHPVQSYFAQSRPYSFGLEAGVAFGR